VPLEAEPPHPSTALVIPAPITAANGGSESRYDLTVIDPSVDPNLLWSLFASLAETHESRPCQRTRNSAHIECP
jgi:hypothetical protein